MQNITEGAVLARITLELPDNLTLATKDFQEGWSFVQSGDVHWLDREIRSRGWHFIWIAKLSQRGGVGQTAQEAMASALKLALRRVDPNFNAAHIEHIELIQYPWFFIAKVRVYPYRIQEGAVLQVSDGAMPLPVTVPVELIPVPESLAVSAVS
jgi:hypothetical protein